MLLQEIAYPLQIQSQLTEFLDGLSLHMRIHPFREYFYQHLLLSEHVRYGYVLFFLLLQYQSIHHDRLGNQIEKFDTLLDYQGRNSFYGQILYVVKFHSLTLMQHAFQIQSHVY